MYEVYPAHFCMKFECKLINYHPLYYYKRKAIFFVKSLFWTCISTSLFFTLFI